MFGLLVSCSRYEASAPANTKLGAVKRAAGDIDYSFCSRRLRAVPTFLNSICQFDAIAQEDPVSA
jgi:hypothetical protein